MNFNLNEQTEVVALLGAGSMGTSIIRRFATNKIIVLGDISEQTLERVEKELTYSGYTVFTKQVDATQKDSIEAFAQYCASLGNVMYFVDTAGDSPSQASSQHIINLDLIGTAYALDAFGKVMAKGGTGLVISSQAGHMRQFTVEEEKLLALTPADELKDLTLVTKDAMVRSGDAYMIAKKCNILRVRTAAATSWAQRGARINTISPGVVLTPLAYDELAAQGEAYQKMIAQSPMKRVGTADEIARVGAFLLSAEASFITGTDLLIDGGVIAAMKSGTYQLGAR